jgi:hypothetical protein
MTHLPRADAQFSTTQTGLGVIVSACIGQFSFKQPMASAAGSSAGAFNGNAISFELGLDIVTLSVSETLEVHLSEHSKAARHFECAAHASASSPHRKATQLWLGGNSGQLSFIHDCNATKCFASEVLAKGAVQWLTQSSSLRQSECKTHFPKAEIQFLTTHTGLGVIVSVFMGQWLLRH